MIARATSQILLSFMVLLFACLFILPLSAQAEDEPADEDDSEDDETDEGEEESQNPGVLDGYLNAEPKFGRYGRWLKQQERMALGLEDLTTMPQGYLALVFGWGTMRPYARFDEDRKLTDLLPVLSFEDPFHYGGKFFDFSFNLSGNANGFMFALMYGVTDRITVGASTMFMDTEIHIKPIFQPGTSDRLGIASLDDFYDMLEQLGHPAPVHTYKSDPVDWGDTTLDVMWNYWRASWISTTLVGHVYLPTAHQADPNKNMIFAMGPDIDTGYGAWGAGLGLPVGFKLPKPANIVGFGISAEGAYFLPAKRKSPTFLPINQDVRDYLEAQGVDVDLFQDLTDIDEYYTFQPGPWVAVSGSMNVGPLSLTYRHGWGFEAKYDSNSEGFNQLIDYIGLVGNGDDGKLSAQLIVPLTPLYIPAVALLKMDYQTDGRNTLIWRDAYQVGIGFLVPIAPPDRYKYKGD